MLYGCKRMTMRACKEALAGLVGACTHDIPREYLNNPKIFQKYRIPDARTIWTSLVFLN
jgi:hypothetical protein